MSTSPVTEEIAQHHENLQRGLLRIQVCSACDRRQWPPRPVCPACSETRWEWSDAPPTGRLFTWTVVHRTPLPAFTDLTPYAVGVFDIGDGLRVIGRIIGPPASLVADGEFTWEVEDVDGAGPQALWRPAETGQEGR